MPAAAASNRSTAMPTRSRAPKPRRAGGRTDARPVHVDGLRLNGIEPSTARPGWAYRWVHLAGEKFNPEYYEALGFEPVKAGDGERPLIGRTPAPGEPFVWQGQMLMRCNPERYADIVENGPYGSSGQAGADVIENQIVDRRGGGFDPLRGLNVDRRTVGVRNRTRRLKYEEDLTPEDDDALDIDENVD